MAKRKRLQPTTFSADSSIAPIETKSAFGRVGPGARHAPIADVSGEAAHLSAFEEVAEELRRVRSEGRLVLNLPLSSIEPEYLVRDRMVSDSEDMTVLTDSLRDRGQQTPVEVVDLGSGLYGLISGWRRFTALRALSVEDVERFGVVQALVRDPETASDAYRAMVEENEIRADLSFYERAHIAVKSVDQGVFPDTKVAVQSLFSAARAPKRSKILSFVVLVKALNDTLRFPAAIPEKLGLPLAAALQDQPDLQRDLAETLKHAAPQDAAAERALLERTLKTSSKRTRAPKKEAIAPGLALEIAQGRAVLSGKAVDAALLQDLRAWLSKRMARLK